MSKGRKMKATHDARVRDFEAMMASRSGSRTDSRKASGGFHKPGAKPGGNPKGE